MAEKGTISIQKLKDILYIVILIATITSTVIGVGYKAYVEPRVRAVVEEEVRKQAFSKSEGEKLGLHLQYIRQTVDEIKELIK